MLWFMGIGFRFDAQATARREPSTVDPILPVGSRDDDDDLGMRNITVYAQGSPWRCSSARGGAISSISSSLNVKKNYM